MANACQMCYDGANYTITEYVLAEFVLDLHIFTSLYCTTMDLYLKKKVKKLFSICILTPPPPLNPPLIMIYLMILMRK